jgi:hypothetical protein
LVEVVLLRLIVLLAGGIIGGEVEAISAMEKPPSARFACAVLENVLNHIHESLKLHSKCLKPAGEGECG